MDNGMYLVLYSDIHIYIKEDMIYANHSWTWTLSRRVYVYIYVSSYKACYLTITESLTQRNILLFYFTGLACEINECLTLGYSSL